MKIVIGSVGSVCILTGVLLLYCFKKIVDSTQTLNPMTNWCSTVSHVDPVAGSGVFIFCLGIFMIVLGASLIATYIILGDKK